MASKRHILDNSTEIDGRELPGYKKKSFAMAFGGGEIWFEHIDGLHQFCNLACEKLTCDYKTFKRPSMPSLIAINIDETNIDESIIATLKEVLLNTDKRILKVAFVGVNGSDKRKFKKEFNKAPFTFAFINDFEEAKMWLVNEKR